jgi:hypothetical protein
VERLCAEARQLVAKQGISLRSDMGRTYARLERARQAFEAGEPLFRGERVEDLPERLRRNAK